MADSESLRKYVDGLAREATAEREVPADISRSAAAATMKALDGSPAGSRLERRARAYFWTVVRKSSVRAGQAPELSARYVLSTVAADLSAAGRTPQQVWRELERGWSEKVPQSVLLEYRDALCA